ncbi:sugar kinase [Histidinibacterium aquaticum]|uniref:Sugar kinase n=1 Tax=Histidinibacterium aquaticum TaxID=2613962 RepID=A0A5J5GM22_9RHOB|nr:sugar kinase [Histidinibacterium aquaticum]KAA9009406.1 sugar kinase [Histidinibacterium aquaticum]
MNRLLCIGECMIEFAPAEGGLFAKGYAGDTFNTAWYAARTGGETVDVSYLTAVGDDPVSDSMLDFMSTSGVRPIAARRAGGTVGLYLISLRDGERSFSYWRSASAARTLADDLEALPDLAPGDIAYFSGITLAILPPGSRARLLSVLAAARAKGIRVAFDPNLRPRLWPDTETMCTAIAEGARVADIALPSFEDEADHFGDGSPEATAERYARAGASVVAVKNGPGDMLLREGTRTSTLQPTAVSEVVDTTAAGDSFNAAFLVGLLNGEQAAEAADAGARLAARVIGARGALVEL